MWQKIRIRSSLIVLLSLIGVSSARAETATEKMRQAADELAADIVTVLESEKLKTVMIGVFSPPTFRKDKVNFGPGFERLISEAIEIKRKGTVVDKGDLDVSGKFTVIETDSDIHMRIIVDIVRADNKEMVSQVSKKIVADYENKTGKKIKIEDPAVLQGVLGVDGRIKPNTTAKEQKEVLKENMKKSPADIEVLPEMKEGTRVRPRVGRPYFVEILAAKENEDVSSYDKWLTAKPRVLKPDPKDGSTTVNLDIGEKFAVKVYNTAKYDVAINLTIDGIDVFHYSAPAYRDNGKPLYQYYIVPAGKDFIVTGWFHDMKQADTFLVTGYGKGLASREKPEVVRGTRGVIAVSFAKAWVGDTPPEDPQGGRNADSKEVDKGPPTKVDLEPAKHKIGPQEDFVHIRFSR